MAPNPTPPLDPLRGHSPEIREEDRRVLRLTRLVDLSLALIRSGQLSLAEANAVTAQARSAAELLFPGSAPTFDLIHAPRFRRAIGEVFAIHH